MARKRKRAAAQEASTWGHPKRLKLNAHGSLASYPLLGLYYPKVSTLRDYILSRFPKSSRLRKQRVRAIPSWAGESAPTDSRASDCVRVGEEGTSLSAERNGLSKLLGTTVVGYGLGARPNASMDQCKRVLEPLSQKLHSSVRSSEGQGNVTQHELVEFAVGHLFYGVYRQMRRPPHVLCNGFEIPNHALHRTHNEVVGSNGLVRVAAKTNASIMSNAAWQELLQLLGKDGDRVMLDLILHCGIFQPAEVGKGNLIQLSGVSLSELPALSDSSKNVDSNQRSMAQQPSNRSLGSGKRTTSDITFVRSRMLYARAALNAKGGVRFGLRHIHVFNRYPDHQNAKHVIHVMKYIFPRQFRLHNVFTSSVDSKETAHPFKDYTLREREIAFASRLAEARTGNRSLTACHLPKRLRGSLPLLIARVLKSHFQCSYVQLLKYYCPIEWIDGPTRWKEQQPKPSSKSKSPITVPGNHVTESAVPRSCVSVFCWAVLSKILPKDLWGSDHEGEENQRKIVKFVDHFVTCRRYENLTLHAVCQDLKVSSISWLTPPKARIGDKMSKQDFEKRKEILYELVYYVFDSILVPLLRSNFHITESNLDRNRLFFFRHDVWRLLTEPSLSTLKVSMFQELGAKRLGKSSDATSLTFSQMRLVPKGTTFRPIMNLRRRALTMRNGKLALGRAINFQLKPVQSMLNYEKRRKPDSLGASMFSVNDMHSRLKSFRSVLQRTSGSDWRLYFAKVDVKSCFDNIPQEEMVDVMERICSLDQYHIGRHAEIKAYDLHGHKRGSLSSATKPSRRFLMSAHPDSESDSFPELVNLVLAQEKQNTVFVESSIGAVEKRENLMQLLREHVRLNKVKIGKKCYRQKQGIPQGSILSSILCSFFYGDFEKRCLGFLDGQSCLLLRLIDDFLLITIDADKAKQFLQVMHDGNEDYGIVIRPEKSLTNFRCQINGLDVKHLGDRIEFPYCGTTINTRSLEISKDRVRQQENTIGDSLTVERFKSTGEAFYRRTMTALKIQLHAMLTDTSLNSSSTVLHTLYQSFLESAMKGYRYLRSLGSRRKIGEGFLMKTISDLMDLAFVLISSRHRGKGLRDYECAISRVQTKWLLAAAFSRVFGSKQSGHVAIHRWLQDQVAAATPRNEREACRLREVARAGNVLYRGYRY